ncbi:MAG: hypothetical protein PHF00_06415 [Elusimicrobia bacterium]|nr:hypothetical protein [Elusimicrobiota bacterium]
MTEINPDFADFIIELKRHRVQFVIVGAFALAHLGFPRATGDMDIWVKPTQANARALLLALEGFGFKCLGINQEDILSGKIIQMGYPPVRIDVITVLDGLTTEEIWDSRTGGPFGERKVYYLGRSAFIKNKRAAARKKDLIDLGVLGESPDAA